MNVIFLDVDGVLNCDNTMERFGFATIGIDPQKVQLLRDIVIATQSEIVLVSSWKTMWNHEKLLQRPLGDYLDKQFGQQGLYVFDKTIDNGANRGHGIQHYLNTHDIDNWIILDDEIFSDYDECDCMPHLVKTEWETGLTEEHVQYAIDLLEKMRGNDEFEL